MVEFTKKCNLHCKYCFKDFKLAEKQRKISIAQLSKICDYIIKHCKENELKTISFQPWGGESLLCIEGIVFAKKKLESDGLKVFCTVQTNGTVLTEKNVKSLQTNNINVGISIDGFEAIQNFQRPYKSGDGTYKDVIKGIENLKKYNAKFGFLCVVMNKNINQITSIIDHFVYDLNVRNFKLNIMRPNKNQTENSLGILLPKLSTFVIQYFNHLVTLVESGVTLTERNVCTKLRNISFRDSSSSCKSRGCMGRISLISFDKEGNIYPCELTDHIVAI